MGGEVLRGHSRNPVGKKCVESLVFKLHGAMKQLRHAGGEIRLVLDIALFHGGELEEGNTAGSNKVWWPCHLQGQGPPDLI